VLEKDEPVFEFAVSADVTDTSGETRSAQRRSRRAYTALRASLSAPDWLVDNKPFELTLSTHDAGRRAAKAEGALKIYQLKQPEKVVRPSLLGSSSLSATADGE
jgi:hypothetical protein